MKSEFIMIHKKEFFKYKNRYCSMSSLNFMIRTFYVLETVINDILNSTTLGFMNIIFIITTIMNMITFVSYIFFFIFLHLMHLICTENMTNIRLDLEGITLSLEFLFLFKERNL